MEDSNTYQKVINTTNDKNNQSGLANSLRYRDSSAGKYKKWSPEISTEERFRKKKQREDEYIQSLLHEEKPILLIKDQHVYPNVKDAQTINGTDKYAKISKNTEVVKDFDNAIQANSNGGTTKVHRSLSPYTDPFTLNFIYQLKGIEFLPKGFIELEPLLYKDEYAFENKLHENLFEDEQRKIKSLRRKQYTQKDSKKQRDVTIFVVDQYKDHMTDYLEEWYARNNRRMTREEIEYVAKILNTDPEVMSKLQDLYLKKKKILNAQRLKDYLTAESKVRDERINNLPAHIRKQLMKERESIGGSKNKKPNSKSKSPTVNSKSQALKPDHNQQLKNQISLKAKTNDFRDPSKSGSLDRGKLPITEIGKDKDKDLEQTQDYHNSTHYQPGNQDLDASENEIRVYYDTEINSILDRIRGSSRSRPHKTDRLLSTNDQSAFGVNKDHSDVINIKMSNVNRSPANSLQTPNRKSTSRSKSNSNNVFLNTNESDRNSKPQALSQKNSISGPQAKLSTTSQQTRGPKTSQLIEEIAKEVLSRHNTVQSNRPKAETDSSYRLSKGNSKISDSTIRSKDYSSPIRMSSQLKKYEADPEGYKERSGGEFNDNSVMRMSSQLQNYNINPYIYKAPGLALLDKDSDEIEIFTDVNTLGHERSTADFTDLRNSSTSEQRNLTEVRKSEHGLKEHALSNARPRNSTIVNRATAAHTKVLDPKRITIVSRTERGDTIVSQKLRPTLVGNQYYYQIIDDMVEFSGKRKTFITVKNEQGEIIAQHPVAVSQLGSFHHGAVVLQESQVIGKPSHASLLVRNENGDTLSVTEIPLESHLQPSQTISGVFGPDGVRRSTVITSHSPNETLSVHHLKPIIVGNEFYRQSIVMSRNSKVSRLTVTTYNENGEPVSISNVNPELAGQSYVSYVDNEHFDDKNIRTFTINTISNRGELVAQQSFSTHVETLLKDYRAASFLEEIEDVNGRRTLTLIQKEQANGRISLHRQYRPSIMGEQYYLEVVNDVFDAHGNRTTTISARSNNGQRLIERTYAPTGATHIIDEFLSDLQRSVEEELDKDLSAHQSISLRPMNEEFTVQIIEDKESGRDGTRNLTVLAKDARGKTLIQKIYRPTTATDIGDAYFADILADLEAELEHQRRSTLAKKSVLGNRLSRTPTKHHSKLESIPEKRESTWNSINKEVNVNVRGSRSDTIHTFDNKRDTLASSPFQPQNIYYRRLLEDMERQAAHRGSVPVQSSSPLEAEDLRRKAHTVEGKYREENQHELKRSNTRGSAQRFDKNKTTVDIKNELAKENPSVSNKRGSSQSRPLNISDVRIKSPSPSLISRRESKPVFQPHAQDSGREHMMNYTAKTSLRSNSRVSDVNQSKIIEADHQAVSERHSRADTLRESQQKEKESDVFRHSQTDSVRHPGHHIKSIADSFDPRDSLDGQTRNLIEKSQQLKGYLDDYINTLTHSNRPNREDRHADSVQMHSLKKSPSRVRDSRQSLGKDHHDHQTPPKMFVPSSAFDEKNIREKIKEVFETEKEKISTEVLDRVKRKAQETSLTGGNLLDEFYDFCEHELPLDKKYKDSVLLVSLFYYFLEKKNLIDA